MEAKDSKAKKANESDSEKPEVPEDFICIDPQQKPMVLQFLSDFNQNLKDEALVHLKLCLHCREIAANLPKIHRSARPKPPYYPCWDIVASSTHVS
jgi:hypothetical protein